jgi:hypothetical protein
MQISHYTPEGVPFIEPILPEQNGDDFTPEILAQLADKHEQAERDFEPINQRLNMLNDAVDDGWRPSRIVQGELNHLNSVISAYHVGKYPTETRQTLDDAEADLARWCQMTPDARDEIWKHNDAGREHCGGIGQTKRFF